MTVTVELKINTTQTRFSKNLSKAALWSGPYKMLISIPLTRNTWTWSVSEYWWHVITKYFVKSHDLALILWAVLYSTDQLFAGYYRLLCKIANLWDIDLKFSGFISDVNMDNPAKFREVSMPRSWTSKNRDFRDFGL